MDATSHLGLSSIQKTTTVNRILAYGCAINHYDEYIKVDENAAIKCLKAFCNAIIVVYAEEYMCPPNEADIAWLLQEEGQRGFPDMLDSIDCIHWKWKNCLMEWYGTHMGRSSKHTLILEAVTSQDLWIWHAFFGMSGSYNDINVLDHSPIFNGIVNSQLPSVNYVVNGHHCRIRYYQSDGIHPKVGNFDTNHPTPKHWKRNFFCSKTRGMHERCGTSFWGIADQEGNHIRTSALPEER
ncbi:uncharacterized protein LOC132295673 [Cornus florida]|uniref:uncharacterized protein LOC132295673 n=1 Tax=Cornus florida TaxID=4283 RepID=UPI00289EAE5F|nr:uncharacterized protein LOC132295673 [Cornus florida]